MGIRRSSRASTKSQASIFEQDQFDGIKPQLYVVRHVDYRTAADEISIARRADAIEQTAKAIARHISEIPQLPSFNFLMILHTLTPPTQATSTGLAQTAAIKALRPVQTRRSGELATFPPEDIEALHTRLGGDALKLAMESGLPTIIVGHWDTAKIIDSRAPKLRYCEAVYIGRDEIIDIHPGYEL